MNFPSFVKAMRIIHACRPGTRFLVASLNEDQRNLAAGHLLGQDLPVELHAGKTNEIIRAADVCMSVSGSVGLELLHGGLPSVVAYRIPRHDAVLAKLVMKTPYISLVNLLAGEELFPEFLSVGCQAEGIAEQILQWLDRPSLARWVRAKLLALKQRVAFPGACRRTAEFVLDQIGREPVRKAA